ncbi:clavesin-2-like [Anabrus simplex]|uniref:clavesin-2-like n=1 Tax=Anabrus simplex TaxID=316456 RepID=UPI0035A294E5
MVKGLHREGVRANSPLQSRRHRAVEVEELHVMSSLVMPADNMFPGLGLSAHQADPLVLGTMAGQKPAETSLLSSPSKPSPTEQLAPEWQQRAADELNETPETARQELESFRNMVAAEANLHVRTDDAFLLRFLRARKFNCTKAFHMLQRYYVMKLRSPELFKVPRPSEKSYILEMQVQNMLEDRDSYGRRVYIFRVEKCDAAAVSIEDIFRTNVMALEHIVEEPETQIAGLTVIVDMNGFGLQHAKFLSPYYARRTVEVIQETFPLRFKGFHVINQPFYFDAVFAVLKPFLKEKIRRRIYFHGRDLSSLHAFIKPDILPAEYGGTKPSFDNKKWRLSLLANEQKFVELESYGYRTEEPQS